MNQPIQGSSVPTLEYINFINIEDETQAFEALKNGTADTTMQFHRPYEFLNLLPQIQSSDHLTTVEEIGHDLHFVLYNSYSPIFGLFPVEPCKLYNDTSCPFTTTVTTPTIPSSTTTSSIASFDSFSSFLTISVLVISIVYSRKKK